VGLITHTRVSKPFEPLAINLRNAKQPSDGSNRDFAVATRSDWWLIFLDSGQFCRTKAATICSSQGHHKIVARSEEAAPAFVRGESHQFHLVATAKPLMAASQTLYFNRCLNLRRLCSDSEVTMFKFHCILTGSGPTLAEVRRAVPEVPRLTSTAVCQNAVVKQDLVEI
jgi:hypothetical protein